MRDEHVIDRLGMDDICRTERYYSATLLPAVLFHDSFSGVQAFLNMLEKQGVKAKPVAGEEPGVVSAPNSPSRIEIITEMDVVRDARYFRNWLEGIGDVDLDDSAMLRPDVIIVADNLLVVIEAKFHEASSSTPPREQIEKQQEVINKVMLRFPGYHFNHYCHIFLSMREESLPEDLGVSSITWTDIMELSETVLGKEHYVTQRLERGIYLHQLTTRKGKGKNYRGKWLLHELLEECQQQGDKYLIGYAGGQKALKRASPADLRTRNFKWDLIEEPLPTKNPSNWIRGDLFLYTLQDNFPELLGLPPVVAEPVEPEPGRNYRGKYTFDELLPECQNQGDQLLIGFSGGESSLQAASLRELKKRTFKWDWSADPRPPKVRANWISGDRFLEILRAQFPELL